MNSRLSCLIWFQVAVSVLWLLFGAATGMFKRYELAEVDDDSAGEAPWGWAWSFFWVIWVYMWSYTGFWAVATGNKLWMIIYNIGHTFYFAYCFVFFFDLLSDASDVAELSDAFEAAGLESPYCCHGWITLLGLIVGAKTT
jgi:Na+/melibiose symporter-like transporter